MKVSELAKKLNGYCMDGFGDLDVKIEYEWDVSDAVAIVAPYCIEGFICLRRKDSDDE